MFLQGFQNRGSFGLKELRSGCGFRRLRRGVGGPGTWSAGCTVRPGDLGGKLQDLYKLAGGEEGIRGCLSIGVIYGYLLFNKCIPMFLSPPPLSKTPVT